MSMLFIPKYIHPTLSSFINRPSLLCNDMTDDELDKLDTCSAQKKCDAGEYLLRQCTPNENVYVVISGMACVERISCDGRRQILGFLFPGDFLGMSKSSQYDYAVYCITKVELYRFNREHLYQLAEELPHLKENINNVTSKIFFKTLDQLYILGQKKAHERLCFLFLQLLERSPGASIDKIELFLSRQDIADYSGLTIETVSRTLSKLKESGLIEFPTLNHLRILDIDKVSELASI